jgi:hypothetical protein
MDGCTVSVLTQISGYLLGGEAAAVVDAAIATHSNGTNVPTDTVQK